MEREKREELALHLTAAYYSVAEFEREVYLRGRYHAYLARLREIPAKTKLLIAIDNVRKPVLHAFKYVEKYCS